MLTSRTWVTVQSVAPAYVGWPALAGGPRHRGQDLDVHPMGGARRGPAGDRRSGPADRRARVDEAEVRRHGAVPVHGHPAGALPAAIAAPAQEGDAVLRHRPERDPVALDEGVV